MGGVIIAGAGELHLEIKELDRQRAVTRAQMTHLLLQAFCTGQRERRESSKEGEIAGDLSSAQARAEGLVRVLERRARRVLVLPCVERGEHVRGAAVGC